MKEFPESTFSTFLIELQLSSIKRINLLSSFEVKSRVNAVAREASKQIPEHGISIARCNCRLKSPCYYLNA